jgi:hypothetical protein
VPLLSVSTSCLKSVYQNNNDYESKQWPKVFCVAWVFLFSGFVGTLVSSGQGRNAEIVAFYNLENLFDTIDTPGVNDLEFTPEGPKKWNSEKYSAKLGQMALVLAQLGH